MYGVRKKFLLLLLGVCAFHVPTKSRADFGDFRRNLLSLSASYFMLQAGNAAGALGNRLFPGYQNGFNYGGNFYPPYYPNPGNIQCITFPCPGWPTPGPFPGPFPPPYPSPWPPTFPPSGPGSQCMIEPWLCRPTWPPMPGPYPSPFPSPYPNPGPCGPWGCSPNPPININPPLPGDGWCQTWGYGPSCGWASPATPGFGPGFGGGGLGGMPLFPASSGAPINGGGTTPPIVPAPPPPVPH